MKTESAPDKWIVAVVDDHEDSDGYWYPDLKADQSRVKHHRFDHPDDARMYAEHVAANIQYGSDDRPDSGAHQYQLWLMVETRWPLWNGMTLVEGWYSVGYDGCARISHIVGLDGREIS